MDLLNAKSESPHAVENLVGSLHPSEGPATLVVRIHVREDGRAQFRNARVRSTFERFLRQQSKEPLHRTNAPFRAVHGPKSPVILWLNLNSKQEVDELFERWKETGAKMIEAVEDKPWNLREFRIADLDGNQLRVFYDFNWEMSEERRR